ncbi:MAG: hypothetical protein WC869_02015 [Phycisphaerae bacterium]
MKHVECEDAMEYLFEDIEELIADQREAAGVDTEKSTNSMMDAIREVVEGEEIECLHFEAIPMEWFSTSPDHVPEDEVTVKARTKFRHQWDNALVDVVVERNADRALVVRFLRQTIEMLEGPAGDGIMAMEKSQPTTAYRLKDGRVRFVDRQKCGEMKLEDFPTIPA